MTAIETLTHSDGTLTMTITQTAQLDWLRSAGLSEQFLTLGTHRVPVEERKKLFPMLSEVIEPILARLSETKAFPSS